MEYSSVIDFFRTHDQFLLLTHKRPDGDTIGSAAALCHALRRMEKTSYLFNNTQITETYQPFVKDYLAPSVFSPETVVAVDIAAQRMFPEGCDFKADLAIDHHPEGGLFANDQIVWEHKAACGELVMEIIKSLCGNISREEADLLYMAVSTDTGCFCYSNTKSETFRAAAELLDAGADLAYLNNLLFRTKSPERILLEGKVMSSLRSYFDHKINIVVITLAMIESCRATENDCDDLASLAGQVAGNKAAVTIREIKEGHSKVSLRTDGTVNATEVCAMFGGGGHKMASGCEVAKAPDEVAEIFRRILEEKLS